MDPETLVRSYYEALDAHRYDDLESVLAPEFTQHRPDRTLEGREEFVRFMREERPRTDTSHELEEVVVDATGNRAAVRGRLLGADGEALFAFADLFELEDGALARLETYTR